ncbi:MAG: ABC transporter ATP-binding protein [Thermostichales cyanobacterium SZTDM-1c_bins_54]
MASADAPLLTVDSLTCRFPGAGIPAVNQVSFQLQRGELLAILGPSGCGKTTLLRLIAGFVMPDQGSIRLGGRLVAGQGVWVPPEKRDVGIVFQEFALFPHLTVAANVTFGLDKLPVADQQARLQQVLALVNLEAYAHRYPHELSGGQQQRVALARALAPQPSLILLDEPLSNLDVQVRLYLREEMAKILKAAGTTAIFVTHDQEEALAIADWVAVMAAGRIRQWGSPERIYREPADFFVAQFVTQANFLPAQKQGDSWQTEIGPIRGDYPFFPEQQQLMIRQELLKMIGDPEGQGWITARQFLGREYRYCVQTASGRELHVLTPDLFGVGQRVRLWA